MSYRRRGRREYDVRRMHVQFRNVWEQGISKASQLMNELKRKGWDVDGDLYFSSQADREERELTSEGFLVQKQPVIKWGDNVIYLLAYKPSPTPTPKPKPKPQPQPRRKVNPEENFKRIFWRGKEPDEKYASDGVIMSLDRTMAFVPPSATMDMAHDADEAVKDARVIKPLDYRELLEHERNGKNYVTVMLNGRDFGYIIDKVKKAVRVFGLERSKTRHVKAYVSDQSFEGVMVVTDGSGNKVLIAPVNDPSPSLSALKDYLN